MYIREMKPPMQWQKISTVLLDMDGTLLDKYFDDYFWEEFLPQVYGKQNNLQEAEAQKVLYRRYRSVEKTLLWREIAAFSGYLLLAQLRQVQGDIAGVDAVHHDLEVDRLVIEAERVRTLGVSDSLIDVCCVRIVAGRAELGAPEQVAPHEAKDQAEEAVVNEVDVLVVGGGTAGVVAAIQAGRTGAETMVVERGTQLGGTTTTGGVSFPGLFDAWGKQVIAGIGWELVRDSVELDRGKLPDFSTVPQRHWENQAF